MKVLITGGCGFIGCNIANIYSKRGDKVIVLDDLSRMGSEKNLEWLKQTQKIDFIKQDISDYKGLKAAVKKNKDVDVIYHMAAQVAVTTSVTDPRRDFEINAQGTFNLLEAVREFQLNPVIIYASTNKVYGEMLDLKITDKNNTYQYLDLKNGISETRQLDFHSPYGCSKGSADQYVLDYARIYGINTAVMRQSCIYGQRQFGVEDQGWVAHFTICAVLNRPITIYGDGKQVRDVLCVDDLVGLFDLAYRNINKIKGAAFNIGGGINNQMSLLELISMLENKLNRKIEVKYAPWRPGDQKIYVSDISKAKEILGWQPKISKEKGIDMLIEWVIKNKELFK
ncbi:MAG: SDR family NAD(P)-dependent oxidoreductase [Candidatus Omnitrophica bacterium]|nr:SDR family NAD(P)-dependent oxidoreductase [Candidatus Omnitrophota bacterium]